MAGASSPATRCGRPRPPAGRRSTSPPPVGTGYTDTTNLSNGTTYYYQVGAVNAVAPGPLSNELSATPVRPHPPPAAST